MDAEEPPFTAEQQAWLRATFQHQPMRLTPPQSSSEAVPSVSTTTQDIPRMTIISSSKWLHNLPS